MLVAFAVGLPRRASNAYAMTLSRISSRVVVGRKPINRAWIDNPVKLSDNENILGSSPLARAAFVAAVDTLHMYPDGRASALRRERLPASTAQQSPVRTSRPSVPESRTRGSRASWSSQVR